ncbi:MAG TPA: SDR family oxidoreductase, partial [Acidimicrobiia bacterium]
GQLNYAAAKAGIAAMTIVLARELERVGVRANAIAPVARTRLTEDLAGGIMEAKGGFDTFAPENAAAGAVWLASPLANGITGQVLKIQGGVAQIVRGWRPITEATDDKPWTIETLDAQRDVLFAKTDPGVPPFFPPVEG